MIKEHGNKGKPKKHAGSFVSGDERHRPKKVGDVGLRKRLLTIITGNTMNDAIKYMENEGYNKFIASLESLEGRDYIVAYLGFLEYVKPKLARREVVTESKKPVINIVGKNHPKPVTIVPHGTDTNEHIETIEEVD